MLGRRLRHWVVLLILLCGIPVPAVAEPLQFGVLKLEPMFPEVTLRRPVALLQAPHRHDVWYVVEQAGRVLRVERNGRSSVFVDLTNRVESGPNEAGLLGMAFDPGFPANGRVYLSYTRRGLLGQPELISVLVRYRSHDAGLSLNVASEEELLEVDQPYGNHNGGDIHFGPDGYLYFGLGDGGAAGDPQDNGQNTQTLLGSLLRLDVSGDGEDYQIPPDNPFARGGGRAEIYAYGLRNPWRWSFDRDTGVLWLADVGQNAWEEVNRIRRGGNYGWNLREGRHCYSGECERPGLIDPVAEYSHAEGCSITGGYVYRGHTIPTLNGTYLFGDYCSGKVWGLDVMQETMPPRLLLQTSLNIASFGEDNDGELYVVDLGGRIFRLTSSVGGFNP